MNNKIKITFVALVFGTILSVFSFTDYFKQGKASILNFKNLAGNLSFKVDTDGDKDGLEDIDETYWNTDFQNPDTDGDGFLDGEEVASGHNPVEPGPNDLLTDMNITEKLTELTLSGLYEGSLKSNSPTLDKSLADLAAYATDNAAIAINNLVSPSILKLVEPTKDNQNTYLSNIHGVIKDFLVAYGKEFWAIQDKVELIGSKGFKDGEVINYFSQQQKIFGDIFDRAKNTSIPENWQEEHLKLLGEIKIAVESNRAISVGKDDPIKALLALNYLPEIMNRINDWSLLYINKNRSENINNSLIESLAK